LEVFDMPTQAQPAPKTPAETVHETQISDAGLPAIMPDAGAGMAADADEFIDFDARQDAIGEVRKDGGPAHRLTKKTRAKPSPEPETEY
jgi:hypothetical protein